MSTKVPWVECSAAWRSGNGVGRINEVTLRRARLVLGWVTVSGFDSRRRHFISVCNQPSRSTQPSTLRGMVNEYQPKGGDALQAWCNLQVKLCDPCLSSLEVVTTMRYTNRRILYYFTLIDVFVEGCLTVCSSERYPNN